MHFVLGSIFERDGQWGAEDEPRSAIFQWTLALKAEEKVHELDPKHEDPRAPGLHRSLAQAYKAVGRNDDSFDQCLLAAREYYKAQGDSSATAESLKLARESLKLARELKDVVNMTLERRTLLASLSPGAINMVRAQEERRFSPDLEQLRETVSDRLQAVDDKLGLTDEQTRKIREAHAAYANKYQALRAQRQDLLQSELQALGQVLTPEQREIAKGFVADLKEAAGSREWPEIRPIRETLADRLQAAADKLDLTREQTTKIREAHAPFAEKYRVQRAEQHELVQAEFKTISELLTPEQREKVRSFIEARMVHAPVAQSIAERLRAEADHLGLTTEQREKIRETHRGFVEKYHALNDERQALLQDEHKALCATLTPEQREKVQSFFEDRVVVVGGDLSRLDENQIAQLRETIAERLNAVADKLGITAEQKEKIKETHAGFAQKYEAQRAQRRELRQRELDAVSAILTAEQREKVKNFVEDGVEAPNDK